jgi:hypothetical protein
MEQSKSEGRNTLKGWNTLRQKTGKVRTYRLGKRKNKGSKIRKLRTKKRTKLKQKMEQMEVWRMDHEEE